MAKEVVLKLLEVQQKIQWSGMVRLHQLNEDSESKLAAVQWPPGSGKTLYACASTGLLFDQQSGRCVQSSAVELMLDTLQPEKCTAAQFNRWVAARQATGQKHLQLKRGPKPKGSNPIRDFDDGSAEDVDYASLV